MTFFNHNKTNSVAFFGTKNAIVKLNSKGIKTFIRLVMNDIANCPEI